MTKPYQTSIILFVIGALCFLSLVDIVRSKESVQSKAAAPREAPQSKPTASREASQSKPAEPRKSPQSKPTSAQEAEFFVQGQVYCDTCRAQFMTKASQFMPGASVRLVCREREGGKMTVNVDGETDHTGTYHLPVSGDHEEEICEINLIKSPSPDCSDIPKDGYSRAVARISLTSNSGLATKVRLANPIGFMKKEPLAECREILDELGVLPDQH